MSPGYVEELSRRMFSNILPSWASDYLKWAHIFFNTGNSLKPQKFFLCFLNYNSIMQQKHMLSFWENRLGICIQLPGNYLNYNVINYSINIRHIISFILLSDWRDYSVGPVICYLSMMNGLWLVQTDITFISWFICRFAMSFWLVSRFQ